MRGRVQFDASTVAADERAVRGSRWLPAPRPYVKALKPKVSGVDNCQRLLSQAVSNARHPLISPHMARTQSSALLSVRELRAFMP
jgi:hypothetical protein